MICVDVAPGTSPQIDGLNLVLCAATGDAGTAARILAARAPTKDDHDLAAVMGFVVGVFTAVLASLEASARESIVAGLRAHAVKAAEGMPKAEPTHAVMLGGYL